VNLSNKLITILGPTAVGKTKFASKLAYNFNGEIISADSRQVYIGMDVGTGKDYNDYIVNNQKINYHLIDIIKPSQEFSLYQFTTQFYNSFNLIVDIGKLPFLVGGTGLYLSSIVQNYTLSAVNFESQRSKDLADHTKEELQKILFELNFNQHNTTDLTDKQRLIRAIIIAENPNENSEHSDNIEFLIIGLKEDREVVKQRIRNRLMQRLKEGMIEETEKLLIEGISHEKLRFFGLEYKFLSLFLSGELNYNDMYQKLASAIIQFSKRQMTWFRKMEKEGVKIHWLKNNDFDKAEDLIASFTQ